MKPKIKGTKSNLPSLKSAISEFFDGDQFFEKDWWPTSKLFDGVMFSRMPAANIKEMDKNFQIELAVPGMEKDDFHVSIENGRIDIWAEHKETKEEKDEAYTRMEYNYNSFQRSFVLPENVNEENVKATYENGVLKVLLAKKKEDVKTSKKAIKVD